MGLIKTQLIVFSLIYVVLVAGLATSIIHYSSVVSEKDKAITSLNNQIAQLQSWLESNITSLKQALVNIKEREVTITLLRNQITALESEKASLTNQLSEKNKTITLLDNEILQLRKWLEGNITSLNQALMEIRGKDKVITSLSNQILQLQQWLQSNITALKQSQATISELQTQLNKLQNDYKLLMNNYSKLQIEYANLKLDYVTLQKNYNLILEKTRPLEEVREVLKTLASYVSTSNLFSYINETYRKALENYAMRLLWYLTDNIPLDVRPKYFYYVIEAPTYTGDIIVDWNIQGSNYVVMVMGTNDLLDLSSGKTYSVLDSSSGDEKKPLYISVSPGESLAFVIYNKGTSNVRIYDWRIYEKVAVNVPEDLRKVYAVNYYIATKVPYVSDIGEEAKPPLKTLSEGGDCEDRAVLAASMLLALGYEPSKIALALIDTDGDGIADHASALAKLPPYYNIENLAYNLARLTILFTNKDPYRDIYPPNIMLVPSNIVNGSDRNSYFILIDPPDLTKVRNVTTYVKSLIPSNINFKNYNIIYAETIENLLTK